MVSFILGIVLFLIACVVGIVLIKYKDFKIQETYLLDDNGNKIQAPYGRYLTERKEIEIYPLKKWSPLSFIAGVILFALFTFFGCIASVSTGNTGVVTTFGKVENYTLEAGFHLKAPWHSVTEMDNRVQKSTVTLSCFSSDIQEVSMIYTVNYQIDKANAQEIYRTIGKEYYSTIIEPATLILCVLALAISLPSYIIRCVLDLIRNKNKSKGNKNE